MFKISKKLRKTLNKIAKKYGVKYRFKRFKSEAGGLALFPENLILINKKYIWKKNMFASCFLHELGHLYCYENRIYKIYHSAIPLKTKEDFRHYMATSLRAELYVDRWAEKQFKKYFPKLKFVKAYRTKKQQKWLKDTQLEWGRFMGFVS